MKGLISLVLVVCLSGSAFAIGGHPGLRATPFRPNVGLVPRGVPARNFSPRFQQRQFNQFHFQNSFGYNLNRNFAFNRGFGYGYGVPAAAFAFNRGFGYGSYGVPAAAFVPSYGYSSSLAFAPSYGYSQAAFTPSYAVGGCSSYFPTQAAFAPSYSVGYAPAFATGGCSAYFGY